MATRDIDATIRVFVEKFTGIANEFGENERAIADAQAYIVNRQERQTHLRAEADQLRTAGLVLGFDLFEEAAKESAAANAGEVQPAATITTPQLASASRPFKIKDWVLEAAKAAYPHPARAAELRQRLWSMGHDVHEKTVGMTLYRLSQAHPPSIRREGKLDWYYVPREDEHPPSTDEPVEGGLFS